MCASWLCPNLTAGRNLLLPGITRLYQVINNRGKKNVKWWFFMHSIINVGSCPPGKDLKANKTNEKSVLCSFSPICMSTEWKESFAASHFCRFNSTIFKTRFSRKVFSTKIFSTGEIIHTKSCCRHLKDPSRQPLSFWWCYRHYWYCMVKVIVNAFL